MPLLVEFGAADSSLSGSVPNGLTKLNELVDIYLFESGLSGTLPKDIGNLIKLTNFVSLKQMQLNANRFTGVIPSDVAGMTSLGTSLFCSSAKLSFPMAQILSTLSLCSQYISG